MDPRGYPVAGRLLGALGRVLRTSGQKTPEANRGNLFIIGAARSGTTVLQGALNHSRSVFLFGEPDIYDEQPSPGFAQRYNTMHRAWRNQETKSSFCPPILEEDGSWPEYWERLSQLYRWVGAKIVTNGSYGPPQIDRLFAFHCRRFYQARYIFTFRRPLAVLRSTRGIQMYAGGEVTTMAANMANYAEMAALYLRALRNLPNVRAVFHEDVNPDTFRELGRWLDVPLDGAESYYDSSRVRSYDASSFTEEERRRLGLLDDVYEAIRAAARENRSRLQLEQNDANLSEGHYTPFGHAARKAEMVATHFRQLAETASSPEES